MAIYNRIIETTTLFMNDELVIYISTDSLSENALL
jgi:hypothetical protein